MGDFCVLEEKVECLIVSFGEVVSLVFCVRLDVE